MPNKRSLIKRLDWVETRAANYDQLKKFYRHTLGLPINFEEERKDFIQYKTGRSKTTIAILDTEKTGMPASHGYIPTLEVTNLNQFVKTLKKKGVKFSKKTLEGEHVHLIDFYDPNGNTLQAFEFKHKTKE